MQQKVFMDGVYKDLNEYNKSHTDKTIIDNDYKKKYKKLQRQLLFATILIIGVISLSFAMASVNTKIGGKQYFSISDNGIRMYDDNGQLIALFNDEARNRSLTITGEVMNNQNVNDISRYTEYNGNLGTYAVASITVQNYNRYNFSIFIKGTNYGADWSVPVKGNETGLISYSPARMNFINLYNQSFSWWSNPEDDNNISNIVEIMRLDENGLYVNGTIDSEDGIGVTLINAINVSTDNLNADLIQSPLIKFTNGTGDKLNIDLIYVTDIVVDNIEVTDLVTGGNLGTELCVGADDVLCRCGSCA